MANINCMLDEIKPEIAVVCCYFANQAKAAGDALIF